VRADGPSFKNIIVGEGLTVCKVELPMRATSVTKI
jgi:hypothetical protein